MSDERDASRAAGRLMGWGCVVGAALLVAVVVAALARLLAWLVLG